MEDKKKLAKQMAKKIQETQELNELSQLIKNNHIDFKHKDKDYRITMISYEEQLELEKFRSETYFEYINNDKMMFRKQWIEKYKSKGIDIEAMENEISELNKKAEEIEVKLATVSTKELIDKYSDEITVLRVQASTIHIQKIDLMSYSIEDQLDMKADSYNAYIMLKTKDNDPYEKTKWIRAFDTYEDFAKCHDWKLIKRVMVVSVQVSYNLMGEEE